MRKVTVIGVAVILAISAMVTGTILAQTDDTPQATTTAWLGIGFAETTDGVIVQRVVTGSPAAAGGLLIGDKLVSFDGEAVETADGLVQMVAAHQPGDTVSIVVERNGSERTLEIELGSAPQYQHGGMDGHLPVMDGVKMAAHLLGVDLQAVDAGYEITAVDSQTTTDLQTGDVITAINDQSIAATDWPTLLTDLSGSDTPTLTLTVQRNGEELTVEVTLSTGFGLRGPLDGFGGSRGDFHDRGPMGNGEKSGQRDNGRSGDLGSSDSQSVPQTDQSTQSGTGVSGAAPILSGSPV